MSAHEHLDMPRRRPLGGIMAAVLAAFLILAAGAAWLALALSGGEKSAPDLRGLTLQQAADVTEEAGVGLLARGDTESADAVVTAQEPAVGTELRSGDVIRVDLAKPPANAIVPDARGLTIEDARGLLESAGLHPGALREDLDSTATAGVVTRQDPAAGTELPVGASVSLWVAPAPTVVLPDLSGLTRQEAETVASANGLSIRFLAEITDEVLTGLIFKQSPRAGVRVAPGSQIVAVINGGSPDATSDAPPETNDGASPATPPVVFAALAKSYPFPVLYPTYLPDDLLLQPTPDNPGHRTGPAGTQGFEAIYTVPGNPSVKLSLLEGDWFDPGLEGPTTVDIRGLAATLDVLADTVTIVWNEHGTRYALSSSGIPQTEVLAMASGLRPVPAE
ncbi:MAG: PASTA domain-containing protein [Thermoleophilia bacterium]